MKSNILYINACIFNFLQSFQEINRLIDYRLLLYRL